MTTTIINPCGHQITWTLVQVNDTASMWTTRYKDGEGNEHGASHPGPGTELIQRNCPQCNWVNFVMKGIR